MGLRLAEGISWAPDGLDLPAVDRLAAQGLLERTDERLRVTPRGMLLLDGILAAIVR
jgi:coproporphyrinogen III oxidase-like Fe-S oxidoreductase